MSESHSLMDGKLHVYRRENSRFWQCATYLSGRNYRQSTKETNIAYAREFARDWYLDRVAEDRLRRHGVLPTPPNSLVITPERIAPRRSGEKTFATREGRFLARKDFTARLTQVRLLRNRIAHHEPILYWNLPQLHQAMLEMTRWLSPAMDDWRGTVDRFPEVHPAERLALPRPGKDEA